MSELKHATIIGTPEIALSALQLQEETNHLVPPTAAGGLAYFIHALLHGFYKINHNAVFVAPLPTYGSYTQSHVPDHQGNLKLRTGYNNYLHYSEYVEDADYRFSLRLGGNKVFVDIHRYFGNRHSFCDGFFLNTDISDNRQQADREVTRYLYGGTRENDCNVDRRIALAIVLGRGVVEVVKHYGMEPPVWHGNEGWTALARVSRIGDYMKSGKDLEQAVAAVRKNSVGTVHTPIPVGNPVFLIDDVLRVGAGNPGFTREVLERLGGDGKGGFNVAYALLRSSRDANGVSQKHYEVIQDMYRDVEPKANLRGITNGITELWLPEDLRNPASMEDGIVAHSRQLNKLLDLVQLHYPEKRWSSNVFTATWARRMTEYKRAGLLLLSDPAYTDRLLRSGEIQLVYAGKPNPDEEGMVNVYNQFLRLAQKYPNFAVIPNYSYPIMRTLQFGTHAWLNNPAFPLEACGTSGMKTQVGQGVNVSVPDGWYWELDPELYIQFGTKHAMRRWGHLSEQERWDRQWHYDFTSMQIAIATASEIFKHHRNHWWHIAWEGHQQREYWLENRMARDYLDMYNL